jgi:hypothetical protein
MRLSVLPPGSPPAVWTAFARQAAWREWVIVALLALNALTIVAAVRVARTGPRGPRRAGREEFLRPACDRQ